MAISTNLKINGYRISFTFCDGSLSGVLLLPDEWDMDNPKFLEAIKIATAMYSDGEAFYSTIDAYALEAPYQEEDERLEELLYIVNRLLKYSKWPLDHEDSQRLRDARQVLETELRRREAREPRPKQARVKYTHPGFVYLIQSPTTAYKIGRTINPDDRLTTFHVKLPFEVEYVAVIPTDDMYGLERALHERFADKRVSGTEWFHLAPEDVEYIKSLAVQDE